ncbi:MAG: hypothetical protein K9J27_02855 [Bacteroidales bacterium]|nr:hypothetical protein [Bacteroidales bacterium]MCF8333203.1 hypothetical protein [Bacteroidales bacterium]
MQKFLLYLIFFVFLTHLEVYAQEDTDFERDSVSFQEYAVSLVDDLPRKHKEKRDHFEEHFTENWFSGQYTLTQRDTIYSFTETLLDEGFRIYPDLYKYLLMTHYLAGNKSLFDDWHESIKRMILKNEMKEAARFITRSYNFFYDKWLYSQSSVNWKVKADTFTFVPGIKPALKFKNCNLVGFSDSDTSRILRTSGIFYPLSYRWEGRQGTVYWRRAGYDTSRIRTELTQYSVDLTSSSYEADSARLYDKKLLEDSVQGKFKEGYVYKFTGHNIRYPQFYSSRFFVIENILENITLKGSLRYMGDRLIVGTNPEKSDDAEALLKKDDRKYLKVYSPKLLLQDKRFVAYNASVSLYIGENDSIFHPAVKFEYYKDTRKLKMFPKKPQGSIMPYSNSFHKLDMYCRELSWHMRDSVLNFREIGGMDRKGRAIFESYDYYSESSFYNMQLMDRTNPLGILHKMVKEKDKKRFTNEEMIRFTDRAAHQIDLLLLRLARNGFVIYDREAKSFKVKSKVRNYVMAKNKLRDYDVMRFLSSVEGESNAELNLNNYNLDIKGIPRIQLSDSQRVVIFPKDNSIKMKKNRDFQFSGRIVAGNTEIFGDSCAFSYEKFSVRLPTIDSLRFYIPGTYFREVPQNSLLPVRTVIEDLAGNLRIDKPDNKSGLKPSPRFPILNSKENSFAYYDKYSRFRDVYDRESFKYQLEPFTIDSLDDYYPTGLKFKGHLKSDIFPDIHQPLTIQPDLSLGFETSTPADGFLTYKGKGKYFNDLSLSNQGLIGQGKLNYLSSTSNAHRVIFFPDSARGTLSKFHLEARKTSKNYPGVDVDTAQMRWLQRADSMIISEPRVPFAIYKDQMHLDGVLALTPEALKGRGEVTFKQATIISDEFNFLYDEMYTDAGDVAFRNNEEEGKNAVMFEDYYAQIKINQQKASFDKNPDGSILQFPRNQYISYLDQVEWEIPQKTLHMNISGMEELSYLDTLSVRGIVDEELSGARFVSTNPRQDSLSFIALRASYDLSTNILEADKVKYINVADAAIFPKKERLAIAEDGKIEELKDAKILSNLEHKAHYFHSASVNIRSKNYYEGEGAYQYEKDKDDEKLIYFDSLWVENKVTRGMTKVERQSNFTLDPYFDYFGEVHLKGEDSLLRFDGYYHLIKSLCLKQEETWVKFNHRINPNDVKLSVSYPLYDQEQEEVYASYMFSPRKRKIYPLFLESDTITLDYPFWKADGYITFHEENSQYRIASKEKLNNPDTSGAYFYMNTAECTYESNSRFDMGGLFGRMNVTPAGKVEYKSVDRSLSMKAIMGVDFPFDEKVIEMMSDSLKSYDLNQIEMKEQWFREIIITYLGKRKAEDIMVEQNLYGEPRKLPKEMEQTMFFTDLKFTWNDDLQSLVAAGKIGLGNMGENVISRYMNGVVEIQPTRQGGTVNIYLEPQQDAWYFFTYTDNYLDVLSSDENFNNRLREMKDKNRRRSAEDGKPPFEFTLGGLNLKEFFLQRISEADVKYK